MALLQMVQCQHGSFSTAYQTLLLVRHSPISNSFTAGDANNGTGTISTVYTAGSAGDLQQWFDAAPGTIGSLIMVYRSHWYYSRCWYKCNCPVRHGSNRY